MQFECTRVLHESLLAHFLMYSSETMIWKEKESSRIRAVQMDNLRDLLGISRRNKNLNARVMELCRVTKGLMKEFMWREWRMAGLLRGSM